VLIVSDSNGEKNVKIGQQEQKMLQKLKVARRGAVFWIRMYITSEAEPSTLSV